MEVSSCMWLHASDTRLVGISWLGWKLDMELTSDLIVLDAGQSGFKLYAIWEKKIAFHSLVGGVLELIKAWL